MVKGRKFGLVEEAVLGVGAAMSLICGGCSDYGNMVARDLALMGTQQAVVSGVRNEMEGPRGTTVNVNASDTQSASQAQSPTWYDGKLKDGSTYRGQVLNTSPHGTGTRTWESGQIYTGDFHLGYPHGRGTLVYPDKSKYDGEWRNGKRSGAGTFVGADGFKHDGEWLDHKPHGRARRTSTDGTVCECEYDMGELLRGTATLPSGTVISGEWGVVERGTIRYSDGRIYEGEWDSKSLPGAVPSTGWVEERPHGLGIMTHPDGRQQEGLWRQGEFVGRVVKE